jgi:hypothetical protein
MPKWMYKKNGKKRSSKKKKASSRMKSSLEADRKKLSKKHDMKEYDKGTDYDFY